MGYVKLKIQDEKTAVLIQLTHNGITYEQRITEQEKNHKKKTRIMRKWDIFMLFISGATSLATSIVVNLVMKK